MFLSGKPSHGYAHTEQYAGDMLLARLLNENVPSVYCEVYKHEWPADAKAFDGAAAIVIFCDGGDGHMAIAHLKELEPLMDKGVGLGQIHYAVEVPKGPRRRRMGEVDRRVFQRTPTGRSIRSGRLNLRRFRSTR